MTVEGVRPPALGGIKCQAPRCSRRHHPQVDHVRDFLRARMYVDTEAVVSLCSSGRTTGRVMVLASVRRTPCPNAIVTHCFLPSLVLDFAVTTSPFDLYGSVCSFFWIVEARFCCQAEVPNEIFRAWHRELWIFASRCTTAFANA